MDDLSRALIEALLTELKCPVCKEYMVPPIYFCNAYRHNVCSRCIERVEICPNCRWGGVKMSSSTNESLGNIAKRQKLPCPNWQSGCLDWFSIEQIIEHNAGCLYRQIECPLSEYRTCSWKGFKRDLEEHAKAEHPEYFFKNSKICCHKLSDSWEILSCFGQFFIHRKRKQDGRLYGAVQLIGASSEAAKYKCEFTLRAEKGVEQISNTFFVRSYAENWETIFKSGKCLRLDEVTVEHFLKKPKLKLTITLSVVHRHV